VKGRKGKRRGGGEGMGGKGRGWEGKERRGEGTNLPSPNPRSAAAVCLSVCPSVKRMIRDKMEERSVQIFISYER